LVFCNCSGKKNAAGLASLPAMVQRLHSAAEGARRLTISLFFGKRVQTRHPLTQQILPVIAGTNKTTAADAVGSTAR
jgi:hypothetical protein